jgi:general stress protein YciG
MGGHARAKALGKEGMREIARRGGAATAAKGKEHLAELGRRGQLARAANMRRAVLKEVEAQAQNSGDLELLLWIRSEISKLAT